MTTHRIIDFLDWLVDMMLGPLEKAVIFVLLVAFIVLTAAPFYIWVGSMLLGPVLALLFLLLIRIWLELVVVVFRIVETATEIRDLLSASSS